MADSEGGAIPTGDERLLKNYTPWKCEICDMVHGYTYQDHGITMLHILLNGIEFEIVGMGWYKCPKCGFQIGWQPSRQSFRKLMAHYGQ